VFPEAADLPFIIIKLILNKMSSGRGASRRCTICNDKTIIKTSLWTRHWQRKHIDIQNSKLSYVLIDGGNNGVKDSNVEVKKTVVDEPKDAEVCSQMNTKADTSSFKVNLDEISKGQSSQLPEFMQKLIDQKD
jgi:hypothetical protein